MKLNFQTVLVTSIQQADGKHLEAKGERFFKSFIPAVCAAGAQTLGHHACGMVQNMAEERVVLCGASAYEQKYYYNHLFEKVPKSIQDELHIICVLFTEEVGGVITFVFEPDGTLSIDTEAAEEDIMYDEISSGLLVSKIRNTKQELLESLDLYYRIFVKHEDVSDLLSEDDL